MNQQFDIIVVASKKRPPLITEDLAKIPGLDYQVSFTPDFPLTPEDDARILPEWRPLACNPVGAFRCFRGHQEALKLRKREFTLILEDDAVVNDPNWMNITLGSCHFLTKPEGYDVVSLHGREWTSNGHTVESFNSNHGRWIKYTEMPLQPGRPYSWCLGSLAYLVNDVVAQEIVDTPYNGLPMDLYIASKRFRTLVIEKSPFDHGNKYPSLMEPGT